MPSIRFSRAMQILAAAGMLALVACGGGSSSSPPAKKDYEGQWKYVSGGMVSGPDLLNLRSDGTYSDVIYHAGTIGDLSSGIYAEKGTYTFTPDTPGDDTHGTLAFHRTHQWITGAWKASTSDDAGTLAITAGSPRTAVFDGPPGTLNYQYYGAEVAIPSSFPKDYEGQWEYLSGGMVSGPDLLNLRSDGTYSDVYYLSGTIGDLTGSVYAEKGTYTFTEDTAGDDTQGTLTLDRTHLWSGSAWAANPGTDSWTFVIAGGSPNTAVRGGTNNYRYYGPEAAIPTSL